MPEPSATGNETIAILKHLFSEIDGARGEGYAATRVDLAIRNVSDTTIATAVFEGVFYDFDGNVVDTVKHKEVEFKPETSRLIHVTSSIPIYERDDIGSYAVRLVRATTADVEKFQLSPARDPHSGDRRRRSDRRGQEPERSQGRRRCRGHLL